MFEIHAYNPAVIAQNMEKRDALYRNKSGILVTAEWDADFMAPQLAQYLDEEVEYHCVTSKFNARAEAAAAGFDNVPTITFCGDIAYLMALAYGCPKHEISNLVTAKYRYADIDEVEEFSALNNPIEKGIYPLVLQRIEKFEERFGKHLITITDNQSPVDVLTTIIKTEEAILAMYEEPEKIHHIMDCITKSIIAVNRTLEQHISNFGGFKSSHYQPYGMHISDDNAAFLSPSIYKEFAAPYVNRLSEEFGGMAFHCCKGHAQNLKNYAATTGFMGFDAMIDFNPMDTVLDAITGKGVWNLYNYDWAVRPERTEPFEETYKRVIDTAKDRCGLLLNVYHPNKDEALRIADRVKEYALK